MSRSTLSAKSFAERAALFIALVLTSAVSGVEASWPSAAGSRCPSYCRCTGDTAIDDGISVDCRGKRLTTVESTIDQLDTRTTTKIDLRNNEISTIRSRSFSAFSNLTVLLLDGNRIEDIQPYAFHGLVNIRRLSLTGNNLTTIRSDAFAEIVGACSDGGGGGATPDGGGATSDSSCIIDLTRNSVAVVERNAFAWIQRVRIKLGHGGDVPMTISAYSFYGARHLSGIEVGGVPRLALRPRIFTNAEDVGSIEIRDTKLDRLDEFVFEGLRNVDSITFNRVDVGLIESFAFSGIHFRKRLAGAGAGANSAVPPPSSTSTKTSSGGNGGDLASTDIRRKSVRRETTVNELDEVKSKQRQERHAQSGGRVSFVKCRLRNIRTDSFRDANVAHIEISESDIGNVERHAFQSVVGLRSLSIVGCHFTSGRLATDSIGALRGLDRINLVDNDFAVIEPFSFRDVIDTASICIQFRSSLDNVTLMTEAFGFVSDVGKLRLSGGDDSPMSSYTESRTHINVDVGAFRNLVGARHVIIENVRLPTIRRHALSGLSRVGNLTVANCDVTTIEREAFGISASHFGAIEHFDIRSGNQLTCDCSTGSGAGLLRELETHFSSFVASCYVDNSTSKRPSAKIRTQIELRHGTERSTTYAMMCGAAWRTFGSVFNILLTLLVAFFLRRC